MIHIPSLNNPHGPLLKENHNIPNSSTTANKLINIWFTKIKIKPISPSWTWRLPLRGWRSGYHSDISNPGACNWSTCYPNERDQKASWASRVGSSQQVGPGRGWAWWGPEPPCKGGTGCTCCGSLVVLNPIWPSQQIIVPAKTEPPEPKLL